MPSASSLRTWARLLRARLHSVSPLPLRSGRHDNIRFGGHAIGAADRGLLAWMAFRILGRRIRRPGLRADGRRPGRSRGANERNATQFGVECRRAAVVAQVPTSGEVRLMGDAGGADTGHHLGGLRVDDAGLPALRARLVAAGRTVAMRESPSDPAHALISARR